MGKPQKIDPRNLVVCIDGTSNQFGLKNTNVIELYRLLAKDENQITFYNSGIGTYATPSWKSLAYRRQQLYHKLDLAIAWNFERIVQIAYQWLSEQYRDGDKIFLFGFSRGAYQVRCLSAMIHTVGLIHRGNEAQIAFAYQLYANERTLENPSYMAERFKETFSREVKVHFVGAWDTVSSVGVIRDKTLPGTTEGMKHANFFRHALALDERRVKFLPEYAYEGCSLPTDEDERRRELKSRDHSNILAHTKEVWFAGTHSDIAPSLRWMSYQATAAGLRVQPVTGKWDFAAPITIHESLTRSWWPFEMVPWVRLTYHGAKNSTMRPHQGMPRHIHEGQMIHSSLLHDSNKREEAVDGSRSPQSFWKRVTLALRKNDSSTKNYVPKASLKRLGQDDLRTWGDFYTAAGSATLPALVERDLNDLASELVHGIRAARPFDTPSLLRQFVFLASSGASALLNPILCIN
ncbi:uncharacterized protein STEHIDRAFT_69301 [Stereum hirsutum FP-91666 SS1]|uniref:T6SS Phospholipase effector Tle1-like catalytic domain-containing protein n=1 Tax=Stereum hirsutum (strain FP-91666) TaxID=721885 RepID=R7RW95_STEHR|nr:uncharacterized protein STEHIDRAFT_69301 [Stereum hirsutum FP-91666 SS1]EIM79559.1 hypothetical protein STEHIDRAFT_69301 [Stereum hirsutum FP-91666 SS1]